MMLFVEWMKNRTVPPSSTCRTYQHVTLRSRHSRQLINSSYFIYLYSQLDISCDEWRSWWVTFLKTFDINHKTNIKHWFMVLVRYYTDNTCVCSQKYNQSNEGIKCCKQHICKDIHTFTTINTLLVNADGNVNNLTASKGNTSIVQIFKNLQSKYETNCYRAHMDIHTSALA